MVIELETRMDLYSRVAEETSRTVIARYSTSFGLASRLLRASTRVHISNLYALVRLAQLTRPFFSSMRMDLTKKKHTQESFDLYVYGSAEVVGLMCLQAFLEGEIVSASERKILVRGARALGSAFQKVNFLRDFGADLQALGRSYFPGVLESNFDEKTKNRLVDDIERDLSLSAASLPLLPARARPAVALAHLLFQDLGARIRATPAHTLQTSRIRVPLLGKLALAIRALRGQVSASSNISGKEFRG